MRATLFYATLCLCVFIFVFVAARILSHIWRKSDALGEWDSTAKYLAKSKHKIKLKREICPAVFS